MGRLSKSCAEAMSNIKQPMTTIKLTNVATVRLKRKGKRFELACYKNKVGAWRKGVETDLDEVLQIDSVFTNVSKGVVAKTSDLSKAFGTEDKTEIIKLILQTGSVQVSEKERKADTERIFKDIAVIVHNKCINTETKTPFPVDLVEEALKNAHFSVSTAKSTKSQALTAIKLLQEAGLPISRSKMRLHIIGVDSKTLVPLKATLADLSGCVLDSEEWGEDADLTLSVRIEPGSYRGLAEDLNRITRGSGRLEILDFAVQHEDDDDEDLEQ